MFDQIASFLRELKLAARSLSRAKGLTLTVVFTLALGIGANAAMFSLLRGVLLRPLVNRDESHLIFIKQGVDGGNTHFSIPEIDDIRSRMKTLSSFGDFSIIGFTLVGLGEPRSVQAGVVSGSYFQVMGLRPVLGRLLDERDDGPKAAGAAVLTYRFWSTALKSDPSVIGKTIRLDSFIDARPATVVGVLEPCVPYPQDTEIIANVVTSAHHLSATMVTSRLHRMTDLFARLAPGSTLEQARAELRTVYGVMKKEHPDAYETLGPVQISAVRLRDELTSGARTILLVLTAGAVLVFIIACCNVANLILARTIRRERELGIRVALGAGSGALRRTLLTESLMLCTGGAALGLMIAEPMLSVLSRYISKYSVRALDLSVDWGMLWVGAALALGAAILLAYVPRLPAVGEHGFNPGSSSTRSTNTATRKLRVFAIAQIAASFVLVAAAGATVNTVLSLQAAQVGFDTRNVLSITVPVLHNGKTPEQIIEYYREMARKVRELPGVRNVSVGAFTPWRDAGGFGTMQFQPDSHNPVPGERSPEATVRVVSPGFFATLGVPVLEGRDFTDADRGSAERVAIISESLARKAFPSGDPLNHYVQWTDPLLKAVPMLSTEPLRIIGVVPDMDDVNLQPKAMLTIFRPSDQEPILGAGELFVHASSNPNALVQPITRIIRSMASDQPVENPGTLQDIRSNVLSPERLNMVVASIFGGVALLIAVVGIAGVLAFSVSGRTREFGIRLAVGSQPRNLLLRIIGEGAAIAIVGLAVGFGGGFWLGQLVGSYLGVMKMPGALPVAGSALVLLIAAVTASAMPAVRAARIDVIQALRME